MNITFRKIVWIAACWCSISAALAQTSDASGLYQRFPAGSIQSPEQASAALDAVQKEQQRVDVEYKARQRVCYDRFLVTSCLEDEKTRYQKQTATINAIELEASRYQRQRKAQEANQKRQAEEAERLKNAPQDAIERDKNRKQFSQKQTEAQARQSEQLEKNEAAKPSLPKSAKAKADDPAQRQLNAERHRKKVQEAAERRAQMAKKHAENEADRAKKQQERQPLVN